MIEKRNRAIGFSVIVVCVINALSKMIGFVRETLMAFCFGNNEITDGFIMSNSLVNILFSILTTISVLYIPFLAENKKTQDDSQTSQFIQVVILIFMILGIFLFLFQNQIIRIVAPGFHNNKIQLVEFFLPYASISFLFSTINQIFISRLNYCRIFIRANVTAMVLGISQLFGVVIAYRLENIFYLGIFQIIGCILQTLILIWVLMSEEIKMRFSPLHIVFFRKVMYLSIPVILSTVIDEVNIMVDKVFASYLNSGVISAMNYAHLVKQLIFFIIVSSGISVIYPEISKLIFGGNKIKLEKFLSYFIWIISLAIIPITIGSLFYSKYIIKLIYERGQFDAQATIMTSQIFSMYVLALYPLAIRELIQRVLYAYQDTKITFRINAIMSVSNIIINTILFSRLKQVGLAFSTALSAYIVLPLYFISLHKKEIRINFRHLFKEFLVIFGISMICIIPIYCILRNIAYSDLHVVGSIILTMIVYSFCILVIRGKKILQIGKMS